MSPTQQDEWVRLSADTHAFAQSLLRVADTLAWTFDTKNYLDAKYSDAKRELHTAVRDTAQETSLALMQGRLQAKRVFDAELTRLRHRLGVHELDEDLPF